MTKWVLSLVPAAALIATSVVAAPVWYTSGSETGVQGIVTDVDHSGTHVVIEDRDRVYVAPTAQIAMADVRPGTEVKARYVQDENGAKSMISVVPVFHEIQAP